MTAFVITKLSTRKRTRVNYGVEIHSRNARQISRPMNMAVTNDFSQCNSLLHVLTSTQLSIATELAPTATFEPTAPEATILYGFFATFLVCVVAGWVWANQVVPVSRTNLAISKRSGAVREYLDELKDSGDELSGSPLKVPLPTDGSEINPLIQDLAMETKEDVSSTDVSSSKNQGTDRAFERWLFTDWLQQDANRGKPGRRKEPALPILKNAKWNSGDNPILVAFGLIMMGVIFTSVTERIFTT